MSATWLMREFGPDQPILFGEHGNHRFYARTGWSSGNDLDFTWTDGTTATVSFRLAERPRDAALTMVGFPYAVPGKCAFQEAFVYLNGLFLAYIQEQEAFEVSCIVAEDKLSTGINTLAFALPRAVSPHALGLSSDLRRLALAFVRLELSFL